jgi:hypothetical protein
MKKKSGIDPIKILLDLLKLLMNPTIDSITLIQYLERFQIDPNVYLPSVMGHLQMPLIFHCCSQSHLSDFLVYLLERNVNLQAPMMCDDPSQRIELLYYSQTQYIKLLTEHGCQLDPSTVTENVIKLVVRGNIIKLITLYKCGAITKDQLNIILQEKYLLFRTLDQLYEKIYKISQQVTNETQFTQIYGELMKNYLNTFKFFFKNGVNINQIENGESFVQKVLNTYFVPLIEFVVTCQPNFDSEEILHYSNFNLVNRQVMRFIYTEQNYKTIVSLVKDKMTPKKINHKKNLVRKIVQIRG